MLEGRGRGGKMIFRRELSAYYNVIGRWPHKTEITEGRNFGRPRLKYELQ